MKLFFFLVFLFNSILINCQPAQIRVKVLDENNLPMEGVTVELISRDYKTKKVTDAIGYCITDIEDSEIIPKYLGENIKIICFKEGYELLIYNDKIGSTNEGRFFNIILKKEVEKKAFIYGEVVSEQNTSLEDVNLSIQGKSKNYEAISNNFGSFKLYIPANDMIDKESIEVFLKKNGYKTKKVSVTIPYSGIPPFQSIILNKELQEYPAIKKLRKINYFPLVGQFYRKENLSGTIYTITAVSSIGMIVYSNIKISDFEQKANESISDSSKRELLKEADSFRNLNTISFATLGLSIATSTIHNLININKNRERIDRFGYYENIKITPIFSLNDQFLMNVSFRF